MSDYAIVNLKDLDDSAGRLNLSPSLEARFGRDALGGERAGISYQRLSPNFRLPFGHRHARQEELYVILSGSGRTKVGDEIRELRQWDVLRVAPGLARGFEAGPVGLELLAFGAGESGDAELLDDFWPAD
ncbi:MAG TPA: hypothetical protein VF186_03535 [Gaiellaceae bacterium]|jgi:uncharacterized cupin superfamily protein